MLGLARSGEAAAERAEALGVECKVGIADRAVRVVILSAGLILAKGAGVVDVELLTPAGMAIRPTIDRRARHPDRRDRQPQDLFRLRRLAQRRARGAEQAEPDGGEEANRFDGEAEGPLEDRGRRLGRGGPGLRLRPPPVGRAAGAPRAAVVAVRASWAAAGAVREPAGPVRGG